MQKIKLDIVALSHSVTQSHNYAVVLGEEDGNRRLPIVIGGFEAQAIAMYLEKKSFLLTKCTPASERRACRNTAVG